MKTQGQRFAFLVLAMQLACTESPSFKSTVDAGKVKTPVAPYNGDDANPPPVKAPAPTPVQSDVLIPLASPVPDSTVLRQIEDDIAKLNPSETSKTRYFSLQVAKNVGASAQALTAQRNAFKKAINSISNRAALITPVAIDTEKLIYRVNLDDIGLSPAEFDQVISDHYPFNNRFADIGTGDSIGNATRDTNIRGRLVSDVGLIRMDWFNATALLPIPYKKFLRLPNTLAAFEDQFLGEDRLDNIRADDVTRIGFDNSEVAISNRVLEVHNGKNGGFYVSYDFTQAKQGQIFSAPLGPVGTNNANRALEFQQDHISVIATLPNGLFAYFLANAQGVAIDKAPIAILRNAKGPNEFAFALPNGQSCASCHHAGILLHEDTLVSGISGNKQLFGSADLARINRIYQPEAFKQDVAKDNQRYLSALKTLGISATETDPLDVAFRFYSRPMTRNDVMLESGLTEADLKNALFDPEFSGVLNALNSDTGTIQRSNFQSVLPNLVRKFKQDIQLIAPREADFLVTSDCMVLDAVRMDGCVIN